MTLWEWGPYIGALAGIAGVVTGIISAYRLGQGGRRDYVTELETRLKTCEQERERLVRDLKELRDRYFDLMQRFFGREDAP